MATVIENTGPGYGDSREKSALVLPAEELPVVTSTGACRLGKG